MGRKRLFDDKLKWCNKCEKWLPLGAFGENKRTASGRSYYCRTCHNTYYGTFWTKVNAYDAFLEREYHLKAGEYLELWRHQDKKCPVCDSPIILYNRKTVVDFRGGKVRGLLCVDCQKGIEALGANVVRAAEYMKNEAATTPASAAASCEVPN